MKYSRGISATRSTAYLTMVWCAIGAGVYACTMWRTWPIFLAASVVISTRQSALLIVEHECWHYNMFRTRWLNNVVGSLCSGWAVGSTYFIGRKRHLDHHRLLGTPNDPDLKLHCVAGKETAQRARRHFLGLLFGGQLIRVLFHEPESMKLEYKNEEAARTAARQLRTDLAGLIVTQSLLLCSFTLVGAWWWYFILWLAPLVTLTTFANGARGLVEHYSFQGDDVGEPGRLYSVQASWPERAFFAPMNFNYHAEHHLNPAVSAFRLPSLRQPMLEAGRLRLRHGYLRTLRRLLLPGRSREDTYTRENRSQQNSETGHS